MKTAKVGKGTGYSVAWCSKFLRVIMNYLAQQECLMKRMISAEEGGLA